MTAIRHACLVSDQPIPSLTPLIDPTRDVRQVTLIAAPERQFHAQALQSALARRNIQADIHALRDGYDLDALHQDYQLLARQHPEGLDLNITGGSKLMSIAAWEVFNRPQDRLHYIDIRRDALIPLRPAGPPHPIADRLDLDLYLTALGVGAAPTKPANRSPIPARQADLFRSLAKATTRRALKRMEIWLKQFPQGNGRLPLGPHERQQFGSLLGALRHAGLIELHGAGDLADSLTAKPAGRSFITGGWLEEQVFHVLHGIKQRDPRLSDLARGVTLHLSGEGESALYNEIDVLCLWNNTPFIIECKNGRVKPDWNDILYKLHGVRSRIGGLRNSCLLVAAEQPNENVRARARQMDIDLIVGHEFSQLQQHLEDWFKRESRTLVQPVPTLPKG